MLGVPENSREPRPPPPPTPVPWIRDPTKGKGAAPPVVPTEVPLEEDLDAAFAG